MDHSLRLGRIRGIPIEVNLSWIFLFVLVVVTLSTGVFRTGLPGLPREVHWVMGIIAAVLFFASVLLHELAHSLVALEHGIRIRRITLFIFGGVAQIAGEPPTPGTEFRIAIAGPLASLLLSLLFRLAARAAQALQFSMGVVAVAEYLHWINLVLAVFNMVPAFPLDGGRVLRAAIWQMTGDVRRATGVAAAIGQGFAFLLIAFGVLLLLQGQFLNGMWSIFIGWFLQQASQASYAQAVLRKALSGFPVRDLMTTDVRTVSPNLSVADLVDHYFYRYRFAAFPVAEGDALVGLVSLHDVKEVPRSEWTRTTVRSVARAIREEYLIRPEAEAVDALMKMAERGIGRLLVVDGGRLVGIVTRTDIMRLIRVQQDLNP